MKKILFLTLAMIFIATIGFSQNEKYSRIKIYTDDNGMLKLASLGIPLDNGQIKKGYSYVTELSQSDIKIVTTSGFKYDVLIDDMGEYYSEHNQDNLSMDNEYVQKLAKSWPVPTGFSLGSYGGFSTYAQYLAHLDNLVAMYPNLITAKAPVSGTINSIEGRPLYYVKISDNPNTNETEPQVLYTGMTHAREPIGMQHLLYFMYYICQHYTDDNNIKNLIDNTEMYFVPVVNPDGYLYNLTYSYGNGMWRKNRRNNGGSYGVDLNRNYGYMWGYDNVGSSGTPSSETYRGTAAFSEPETQIIRNFCNSKNFRIALNYHSVAALFLHPWGYATSPVLPDLTTFTAYSALMTTENHYTYGPCSQVLYTANGGADDWMYGEQTSKPKIFSWTPEVGGSGFWPTSGEIIPLCQENMWQSLYAAYLVTNFANVVETSPYNVSQMTGYFKFNIQRLGLQNTPTFTVSIIPIGTWIQSVGAPKTFNAMNLLETRNDSISFTMNPAITGCQQFKFIISVNNGLYSKTDTVSKIFGQTVALLTDNCNSITNWTPANLWGITTAQYHSPTGSITDSPSGNYSNNQNANNSITLTNAVNLANKCYASLSFWAKWNIEAGYDFVQVKVSTNNGTSWTALSGKYTKPGSTNQIPGSPLYDGIQSTWVKEDVNLSAFVGQNIKIRFTLQSDAYTVADGFYYDDITITSMDVNTGINENNYTGINTISDAIPNPAHSEFQLNYYIDKNISNGTLVIYNSIGQEVYNYNLPVNQGNIHITTDSWENGIYFYMIKANNFRTEVKKLVIL
jgi:carboxypeptidase T